MQQLAIPLALISRTLACVLGAPFSNSLLGGNTKQKGGYSFNSLQKRPQRPIYYAVVFREFASGV